MKHDDLKFCIEALKTFRREKCQETDASVTGKLDEVIFRLEECLGVGEQEVAVPSETRHRVLEVLGDVLLVVTRLADLIHLWTGIR